MLRVILILFFIFLPIIGCSAQKAIEPASSPALASTYTWNFGQVKAGEVLVHEFQFKNDSKGILNIKNVNTSCGCTVSEVKKKTLSPGENTTISAKFDTKGYSGQTQQFIYVHTDSLDNPVVRFIIKADIIK